MQSQLSDRTESSPSVRLATTHSDGTTACRSGERVVTGGSAPASDSRADVRPVSPVRGTPVPETPVRETPDIETSSNEYAQRFKGAAGAYLLSVQEKAFREAMPVVPDATVLDVGGGHAQLLPVLAELGCRTTVFGSDESCWDRIRGLRWDRSVRLETGDLLNLPFADRTFDVVVAVRLLAHIADWPRLLSECCRVAKHSVVLDYPSKRSVNALTPWLFPMKKVIEPDVRTYASFVRGEIEAVLGRAGYSVATEHKQFLLPMALHRATGGRLRILETAAQWSTLVRRFGSPVILRADRSL